MLALYFIIPLVIAYILFELMGIITLFTDFITWITKSKEDRKAEQEIDKQLKNGRNPQIDYEQVDTFWGDKNGRIINNKNDKKQSSNHGFHEMSSLRSDTRKPGR